eukprot:TRINITY_DN137_c0_g2_i1.p1 TRINITY_DN137_c0_g2~~TRINITY_DN137_c0_g2_i1.p1  ORF type:complete len:170 (-),score=26.98 TRINITY_DN137_c0_g2_i1:567-1076(-)
MAALSSCSMRLVVNAQRPSSPPVFSPANIEVSIGAFPSQGLRSDSSSYRWQQGCSKTADRSWRLPAVVAAEGAEAPAKVEPPKPTLSKGQVVRVEKEKYLGSVEALAVDHPKYFKGLDYIYEARGEVLDVRFFPNGEYALIAWAGIPTAPAWLPVTMLVKASKLSYTRT